MNILSIDSSTKFLSAAVSCDNKLLSEVNDKSKSRHMVNIIGMVDGALSRAKLTLKEIDVFGVNAGPGDFTGTRIGVSVIKMLSWLESKPAYCINSLDSHALGMCLVNSGYIINCLKKNKPFMVMSCLDVRKEEVYFSFYELTQEIGSNNNKYLAEVRLKRGHFFIKKWGKSFLARYDDLKSLLSRVVEDEILKNQADSAGSGDLKILIGGNCYLSYGKVLSGIASSSKTFILDRKTFYPRAGYLNVCAYYNAVRKVATKNLIPVYVREFIPFGGAK